MSDPTQRGKKHLKFTVVTYRIWIRGSGRWQVGHSSEHLHPD